MYFYVISHLTPKHNPLECMTALLYDSAGITSVFPRKYCSIKFQRSSSLINSVKNFSIRRHDSLCLQSTKLTVLLVYDLLRTIFSIALGLLTRMKNSGLLPADIFTSASSSISKSCANKRSRLLFKSAPVNRTVCVDSGGRDL